MCAILEPSTYVTICACEHTVVLIMRSVGCVFCVHPRNMGPATPPLCPGLFAAGATGSTTRSVGKLAAAATAGHRDAGTSQTANRKMKPSERTGPASRTLSTPETITKYATCRRDRHGVVGGRSRQTRLPALSPRETGDRQPSGPSRSAPPSVPPTRGF